MPTTAPMLPRSCSPLLSDAELVECAATADAFAQSAIALRPWVSAQVAAALAEVGARKALITLAVNPGADLLEFSMLIGMLDMTRGVMLPRWPWKIMHTRGESILPISGPKVSWGNWWPRFRCSTAFSPLFGENSLKQEDQEKYQVLRLMANALSISFSWWVAITLAILLTWVFEASFRRQRKCQEIIDRLQAKSEIPDRNVAIATLPEICSTKIEDPPPKVSHIWATARSGA